jgi:aspartate ammonia-lyase
LRQITGLGLARAENLVEATQNADVFIEVSGILRALAGNLLKCSNDLRCSLPGRTPGWAKSSCRPARPARRSCPAR